MFLQLLKTVTYALIGWGLPVPELALSRLPEYVRIKRLLDELAINCVIDVGANRGQTVKLFRGLGFKGYIYSFEPQPHVYAALERACRRDRKWQGFQLALGDATGSLPLKVNQESNEMSSLLNLRHPPPEMAEETVQVAPLDSLFPSLMKLIPEPKVFLKIDTEGYDLNVFRGAVQALPHILALQVELFVQPVFEQAPHYLEALAEFEQAGFELDHLSLVSRTEHGELMTMNALMKRVG